MAAGAGAGGTPPQPRRVRPVEGTPKGKIIGIAAAVVFVLVLLLVIVNAVVGDEAPTRAVGPAPQATVNPVTGQQIPPKPDNFAGTDQEWQALSEMWENELNAGGWPSAWPFLVPFEEASKQAEQKGWRDFCIHGLPKPPDQQECKGENGPGKEIHFDRARNGDWKIWKIFP